MNNNIKLIKFVLLITAVLIIGFSSKILSVRKQPKFRLSEQVEYRVPHFYSLVCDGVGKILRFDASKGSYEIGTNYPCPDLILQETEIVRSLEK